MINLLIDIQDYAANIVDYFYKTNKI